MLGLRLRAVGAGATMPLRRDGSAAPCCRGRCSLVRVMGVAQTPGPHLPCVHAAALVCSGSCAGGPPRVPAAHQDVCRQLWRARDLRERGLRVAQHGEAETDALEHIHCTCSGHAVPWRPADAQPEQCNKKTSVYCLPPTPSPAAPPPLQIRSMLKRQQQGKYASKVASREERKQHVAANPLPHDELADVFK